MSAPHDYDLVVIGGGITGAGIARDAALRGLKVALFEKGDYASGTSSKSTKLIHGGLRYLEHGEIGLVFESVSERRVQTRVAPHLVRPLPFLIPIYKGAQARARADERRPVDLRLARAVPRAALHKTFRGAKAALALEPQLQPEGLRGVLEYYDCATDDARLVLENVLDARGARRRVPHLHRGHAVRAPRRRPDHRRRRARPAHRQTRSARAARS